MARLVAGTRKRDDGVLEKRFTVDGKRYSVYGRSTKELLEKEIEKRNKVAAGLYVSNKSITLDNYFEEWKTKRRGVIKGNTLKTYTSYYNKHISPVFGGKKVNQIERRQIALFLQELKEELTNSTCNTVMALMGAIFSEAVLDNIITQNPTTGIKQLKADKKAVDTIHRALTIEEQKVFMEEMKNSEYYEYVALMISTGMRCGEVSALTWADVDFDNKLIHITKTTTYNECGGIIIGNSTKTDAGTRNIPINKTVHKIIESQRNKLGNIVPMKNKRVFISSNGGIICNDVINDAISATLKRLDKKGKHIEPFTSHALRDTFATRFIEQNGQPQVLKTLMGHSSFSMTMDLYAHVLPNTKQEEMDKLNIVI